MSFCEQHSQGTLLRLWIQPKASRTEIVGTQGDPPRLKIRIAAPPSEGEANEALIRFLAKRLECGISNLALIRGTTSRKKDILCIQMTIPDILKKIGNL